MYYNVSKENKSKNNGTRRFSYMNMMIALDLGALIVSLIMMSDVFVRYKKIDSLFLLAMASITISCLGRFMLTMSSTLETALWGNRFIYIGGCYTPLLLVVILFKLCNLDLPKVAAGAMTLYSTIVMCLVMTIGVSDMYYKEVRLVNEGGYSYLDKIYGPLHILYPIMMVFYGVFLLIFFLCAIKMRKKLAFRTVLGACIMGVLIIAAYAVEKVLELNFSFVSIGYLIAIFFIMQYFDHLNMYDLSSNIVNTMQQVKGYGYIVFDKKCRYISCNDSLKDIFPEIYDWCIDAPVPVSDSILYEEVVRPLTEKRLKNIEKKVFTVDETHLETDVRPIHHGRAHVGYIIEFVDRTMELKYYSSIENYNSKLENEVAAKTENLMHIKDMLVLGMADMVESRDNNTGGHIKRTSAVVKVFADKLRCCSESVGLSDQFLKMVERAAPMHDLGKIAIDDSILRKPESYTDDEFELMKRHTIEGAKIVKNILQGVEDDEFVRIAENVALYHHEKWNGTGYPIGIEEDAIPVEARIMALADVFDALISKRCYKDALGYDEVFSIIEKSLGEHFDPVLGRIFLECREELETVCNELGIANK